MIFTEPRFVVFFLIVFAAYWLVPSHRARKVWLLFCSYCFYAAWNWHFLSLILISTGVDYAAGRMLGRASPPGGRKTWLVASLCANLGILGIFKYFNFFVESAVDLLNALGFSASPATLSVILPVGISFYTFQTLSYTIDVYRGQLKPTRDLLDFALFVGFFPQLVAGPIVRATTFLPQLDGKKRLRDVGLRSCLALFLVGFVKKACVSDNIAPLIDPVYESPAVFDFAGNWLAATLYHIQIYCDFSGYSDMAIAVAGMLGFKLPQNFDFPYVAKSAADFWRRWHISLSSWFRDYVFIPLGGSRVSAPAVLRNLLVTFWLSGLWHGASWNFVVWGLVHFALVTTVWAWQRRVSPEGAPGRVARAIGPGLTLICVLLAWILFRAVDGERCLAMLGIVLGLVEGGSRTLPAAWWLLALGFFAVHWTTARRPLFRRMSTLPDWGFALAYGAALAALLPFAASGYQPFIYFQF